MKKERSTFTPYRLTKETVMVGTTLTLAKTGESCID